MPINPYGTPAPWNAVASAYARTSQLFLERFAIDALHWIPLSRESHLLDVACGPGTLSLLAAPLVKRVTAIDFSPAMLALFRRRVAELGLSNIDIHEGDGQALPFANDSFDAAFSMFGLMFFPDRTKGFSELHRALKPGGRAVVSSWSPADRSPLMQAVLGAMKAMDPQAPEPPKPPPSLDASEIFRQEFEQAGFEKVQIERVTKSWPVASVEAFWSEMVEGHAGLVMLKEKMGSALWQKKQPLALRFLHGHLPTTPTRLTSDAWLGIGAKA
jgi:SAM-dependent methyltransferase